MFHRSTLSALCLALASIVPALATAQSTPFTYQGRLNVSGLPANGAFDLEFGLYGAVTGGTPISLQLVEDVEVANGLFTVLLDMGDTPFLAGSDRWIEISVRPGASTGVFEALSPRQRLVAAPYAIRALASGTSASLNCTNCLAENVLAFDPATQVELDAHRASSDHDVRYARLDTSNTFSGTQSVTGGLSVSGVVSAPEVKLGSLSGTCNAAAEGSIRYNPTPKRMEFCNGSVWADLTGPAGQSGVVNSGQVTWANGPTISAGAWATIPGSTLPFLSSGGSLLITINIPLFGGSHGTCRPIIDGVWAGSYGGLLNSGDPFWQEGLAVTSGNVWHPWHKTRLYPGVPAGNHVLQVQCATDSGMLNVGSASSIASSLSFIEIRP